VVVAVWNAVAALLTGETIYIFTVLGLQRVDQDIPSLPLIPKVFLIYGRGVLVILA
jgi:hypothetical protein